MGYPVQFSVDYPALPLNWLSTAFRIFLVIPSAILLGTINGEQSRSAGQPAVSGQEAGQVAVMDILSDGEQMVYQPVRGTRSGSARVTAAVRLETSSLW